jgi:subtilisin family serine protease
LTNLGRIQDGTDFPPGYLIERLFDKSNNKYYTIDLGSQAEDIRKAKELASEASTQMLTKEKTKCAVLDTGMMTSHPLIVPYLKASENFSQDDDIEDLHGHGTYVTLIFLATSNPESVDLHNIKVLNRLGNFLKEDMIKAIKWCADNKMTLANISAGIENESCRGNCELCTAARDAKDVTIAAAAGNSGPNRTVCPAKAGLFGAENIISISSPGDYGGSGNVIAPDKFGFKPI